MLRFFDSQVNLSTDQGRTNEIEVTARTTGNPHITPSGWGCFGIDDDEERIVEYF
jgi:hypothetical protein